MVRFWVPGDATVRPLVEFWLKTRHEGRVLTDDELRNYDCYFESQRYGELWFLLNEGTILVPSYTNQRHVTGMHGFDPHASNSAACWLHHHDANPAPPPCASRASTT